MTRHSVRRKVVIALVAASLVATVTPVPSTADTVARPRMAPAPSVDRPTPLAAIAAFVRSAASGQTAAAPRSTAVTATPRADADRPAAPDGGDAAGRSDARTFTIAVTGDMLLHLPVISAARRGAGYDFRPLLAGIRRPIAGADLALCHLEVPLTRDLSALSGYPTFNAPHHFADALAATGYDGCSVASNHAFDRGAAGVRSTLRALDAAGVGHAGTARTRREARRTRIYRLGGQPPVLRVAHLSYTYGLNGRRLPRGRRWMVDLIDRPRIVADARRARRAGADLVLVSLHWGQEYVSPPTAAQERLARRLLASPAIDVLVGHHAHVVQPVARRRGKVVVFGLGNLLSNQTAACCHVAAQDGVIVRLVVRRGRDGSVAVAGVEYLPTMVRHPRRRVVVVRDALRRGVGGRDRAQLRASLRRTRRAIGDLATLAD